MKMKEYLTYDDVQIKPQLSDIEHRKDCQTITQVTKTIFFGSIPDSKARSSLSE